MSPFLHIERPFGFQLGEILREEDRSSQIFQVSREGGSCFASTQIPSLSDHLTIMFTSRPTKKARLCVPSTWSMLGNLNKMISDAGGTLPEVIVMRATRMILQGLKALHSEGYIHCDLKPSKVLVFPSTTLGEPWALKLAGFGLSKEPTMDSRLYYPGTLQYVPREATESFRFVEDDLLTGPARDTLALGRTVLEMFRATPIIEMGDTYKWRIYGDISPVATDFVRRCLATGPADRATVDELLDYPFVAEKRPFYLSFLRLPSFIRKIAMELLYGKHEELTPIPQGLDW